MIQLSRVQLTNQTTNHVESTKILSTASVKEELLTASPKLISKEENRY